MEEVTRIYGPVAEGCIALQDRVGLYEKDMLSIYKAKEDAIRAVLAEMPKASEILGMLEAVGMDMAEFYELYSAKKIEDTIAYAKYNPETQDLDIIRDDTFPCDREKTEAIVTSFREKYGFTQDAGDNVEYHPSGCITFPVLGTKAQQADNQVVSEGVRNYGNPASSNYRVDMPFAVEKAGSEAAVTVDIPNLANGTVTAEMPTYKIGDIVELTVTPR